MSYVSYGSKYYMHAIHRGIYIPIHTHVCRYVYIILFLHIVCLFVCLSSFAQVWLSCLWVAGFPFNKNIVQSCCMLAFEKPAAINWHFAFNIHLQSSQPVSAIIALHCPVLSLQYCYHLSLSLTLSLRPFK